MLASALRTIWVATLALVLAACGGETGRFFETKSIGGHSALSTSADIRLVTSTPVHEQSGLGQIKPTHVLCAEPSADLARAVQNSFGLGASLGVDVPAQASGTAALSIARAKADAAAQLGERLATIQLLRDGLYRACEAYANGAISEITYAVLLSRYDDTMVSLLAAELAAGAFGRSLATVSGGSVAGATADATLDSQLKLVEDATKAANQLDEDVAELEQEVADAEADLEKKENDLEDAKEAEEGASEVVEEGGDNQGGGDSAEESTSVAEAETAAEEARENLNEKKTQLMMALETASDAKSVAVAVAAGAITRRQSPEIARIVHEIQRKYIENLNADALIVACVTAMSKDRGNDLSALTKLCGGADGTSGILGQIIAANGDLLYTLKSRRSLDLSVKNVIEAAAELEQLRLTPESMAMSANTLERAMKTLQQAPVTKTGGEPPAPRQ